MNRNVFSWMGWATGWTRTDLAAFLGNPHARYPDGRMPRLPVSPVQARDIASLLAVLVADPRRTRTPTEPQPTPEEVSALARRLGVSARDRQAIASALLAEKGCTSCHIGLGPSLPRRIPIHSPGGRGCLSGSGLPRYEIDAPTREAILAYLKVAGRETIPVARSPTASAGSSGPDASAATSGTRIVRPRSSGSARPWAGAFLQSLPYQRTPRLTYPHQKFTSELPVRGGPRGRLAGCGRPTTRTACRPSAPEAESLVQALAEADGELPADADAAVATGRRPDRSGP